MIVYHEGAKDFPYRIVAQGLEMKLIPKGPTRSRILKFKPPAYTSSLIAVCSKIKKYAFSHIAPLVYSKRWAKSGHMIVKFNAYFYFFFAHIYVTKTCSFPSENTYRVKIIETCLLVLISTLSIFKPVLMTTVVVLPFLSRHNLTRIKTVERIK